MEKNYGITYSLGLWYTIPTMYVRVMVMFTPAHKKVHT